MAAKNVEELLVELRAGENYHTIMRMKQAWAAATNAAEKNFTPRKPRKKVSVSSRAHNSKSAPCYRCSDYSMCDKKIAHILPQCFKQR